DVGNRTPNLLFTRQMLCQLSYVGTTYQCRRSRPSMTSDFVQGHTRCHRRVQGLRGGAHGDAGDHVAVFADQPRQALAFRADDHDQRLREEVDVGDLCVALAVEADDEEAGVAVFAQGGGEVGGAGDAEGGEGARGGLPGAARDAGRAAGGDEEAVGAEGGGGAGDGAEVAGVGDAVEGDDERGFGRFVGQVDEVRRVGVVVGRDLQGDALVDGALGEPVELVAGDLHEGDPAVGGDFDAVSYAVVVVDAVGHVEGVGRDPGLEGFQDGVAAADVFGRVFG